MQHRILLLSADFGSGHLAAARAVAAACRAVDPTCEAVALNLEHPILSLAASGYLTLLNHAPFAYRSLYRAPVGTGTRRLIRTVLASSVRRTVERFRPTAVVATHPFPGGVAADLRRLGLLTAPVSMVLTDFCPHPLWVHAGVDRYLVASDAAGSALVSLGVPPWKISVTGIPIRPDFSPHTVTPPAARRVLVMGGGLGLGPVQEAVEALTSAWWPGQAITVVTGRNTQLRQELQARFGQNPRVEVLGYSDSIPALMASASLLVTKPGGMTCAEAMAAGLPMLLLDPLPGHEEENAAWLEAVGAGVRMAAAAMGVAAADLLHRRPERLALMRESARLAGQPLAARSAANAIFIISSDNRHKGAIA